MISMYIFSLVFPFSIIRLLLTRMVREALQHEPDGVQGAAPAHEEEAGAEQPHPHRHRPSLHMFAVPQDTLQGMPVCIAMVPLNLMRIDVCCISSC